MTMTSGQNVDVIATALSGAIATNGTITFTYPAGRAAASYIAGLEYMYVEGLQSNLQVGSGKFSISYGSTSATVTYLGSTTIPAGTTVRLQLAVPGYNTVSAANAAKSVIVMPLQLADIATGTYKVGVPFNFTVLSALFRTGKPASTASKLATLTVGIGGTGVTGGVMSLTTANQNTIGGSAAATAITAANSGAAGATLEVTASSVTAFVEGDGWVEFTVQNNDLAPLLAFTEARAVL